MCSRPWPAAREAHLLDRLPQLPEHPLWTSYPGWFDAIRAFVPVAARERVGMREVAPGVWVGMRSRVAETAKLQGPCWIGANVFVGPGCVLGPDAFIEDGAYIEESAEVVASVIGPRTYLGALTEVRQSFAWGRGLLNLPSGSFTEITDRFLLDELSPAARAGAAEAKADRPAAVASGPARILERALAIAPGLWRKWSKRPGGAG